MSRARDLPRLVSNWANGAEFRAQVREADGVRMFFHPVKHGAELPDKALVGQLVSVSLRFIDRDTDFHVHAKVMERVTAGDKPGLLLAFLPEERDRQELVLAIAEGESVPYLRRKAIRTPCNLDVQVLTEEGKKLDSVVSTISERGAHLDTDALAKNQRVQLAIRFPNHKGRVTVGGRVTARIAGPEEGVGIEFIFQSSKQRDELAVIVQAFRSTLAPQT